MVVQVGIEKLPIEAVDGVGVAGIDVSISHVLADDGAVLGLDQAVVAALPGTAFGLLDEQFVEQFGDGAVDELASVVGVEAEDAERKLAQHALQQWHQIQLADTGRGSGDLPLRDLIDGVDVIDTLGFWRVALMHRIETQIARLPAGCGLAPLADGHRRGSRFGVVQAPLAVALAAAQVVQMGYGDGRQPCVLLAAVELDLALENAPCGRAAQGLMRLVDRGQQLDVGPREALGKTPPPIDSRLHPAAGREAGDQPRDLRPAPPGHLLDVAPQQAARRLALLRVLMLDQNALYPAINLAAICPLKPDFLAGRDEPANPFQMQILCLMHADVHSPA